LARLLVAIKQGFHASVILPVQAPGLQRPMFNNGGGIEVETKTACFLLSLFAVGCLVCLPAVDNGLQAVAAVAGDDEDCRFEIPGPDEDIVNLKGARYKIIDGDVFLCDKGKWAFQRSMLARFGKNYEIRKAGSKCEITVLRTGGSQELSSHFSSGFEATDFRELFKPGGWNSTTLLSPKANTVKKYVELHRQIMMGGDFLDNRMDLDSENAHSGNKALRFYAAQPDPNTNKTSKSMIENKLLCFGKGDHIWFSAWYYLEKGLPATLVDFETGRYQGGPGMRLFIRRNAYATMESKFYDKPQYNQYKVPLPREKWFKLKVHLMLSNRDDGIIELWQDGLKILSARGRTLPTHDTIYNMLQVGITATPREATLLVDDVIISNKPF
jgi:hypothetical protein